MTKNSKHIKVLYDKYGYDQVREWIKDNTLIRKSDAKKLVESHSLKKGYIDRWEEKGQFDSYIDKGNDIKGHYGKIPSASDKIYVFKSKVEKLIEQEKKNINLIDKLGK